MQKITILTTADDDSLVISTRAFSTYESGFDKLIEVVQNYINSESIDDKRRQSQAKQLLEHLKQQKVSKTPGNTFFGDANVYVTNDNVSVFFTDFFYEGTHTYRLEEVELDK